MYPASKDAGALDSVNNKNKGPNALADDTTKDNTAYLCATPISACKWAGIGGTELRMPSARIVR